VQNACTKLACTVALSKADVTAPKEIGKQNWRFPLQKKKDGKTQVLFFPSPNKK
jgi:hypothetical protein